MKKIITTLASLAVLASTASADIARLEIGGGAWQEAPSGFMSYTDTSIPLSTTKGSYDSKEEAQTNAYVWMLIKHPIPIIPNVRLEYANVTDKGLVSGTFDGFPNPAPTDTPASYDVTQYDIIPYYNLLDNTFWMTVDVGLDLKIMEADYKVSQNLTFPGYSDTQSIVLPLVYVRGRVEIPVTNIGLEADAKYITYNGSTAYDIRAKVDYTLDFIPVVQPGIEVGYKIQKFDLISDDEKTRMNMDFAGVYAGLMLRF